MTDRLPPPGRLLTVGLLIAFWSATVACTTYSDKSRPGDVDVTEPPPDPETPERVRPDHPGAVYFSTHAAPLLEIGGTFLHSDRRRHRTLQAGAEVAAGIGTVSEPPVGRWSGLTYLLDAPLLVAGWLPYSSQPAVHGRLYLEVRSPTLSVGNGFCRLSGGWTTETDSGTHGPQMTLGLFEVGYLRGNWDVGARWSLMAGLRLPAAWTYVRSR